MEFKVSVIGNSSLHTLLSYYFEGGGYLLIAPRRFYYSGRQALLVGAGFSYLQIIIKSSEYQ